MTKKCPKCGSVLEPAAIFCDKCGASIHSTLEPSAHWPPAAAPPSKAASPLSIFAPIVFFLLTGAIILLLYFLFR